MPPLPRILDGISEVVHHHDWFVVDQWGVLHDGHAPHPGAIDALRRLREVGPVALVSNTSRRVVDAEKVLLDLGFPPDLYDACFTAGELAARWLEDFVARADHRVRVHQLLGPPTGASVLAGQPVDVVDSADHADVLLVAGIHTGSVDHYDPVLHRALDRRVPLLCGNPDVRSIQPDGSFVWCPGAFAERYTALGGPVFHFGKPKPAIYAAARAATGHRSSGLAFGDSMQHDVCGARDAGLQIAFVTRGIHGPDLGLESDAPPDAAAVAELARKYGTLVDYALPTFRW